MKILQAVVASYVETLEGSQGFGVVLCSRDMPQALRKEAKDLGYSDDAKGFPIFSLNKIDVDSVTWLLLNRAVPTVDFTGRSSFVSHSLAFREDEWLGLAHVPQECMTPFEFIGGFKRWISEWDQSPHYLEDSAEIYINHYGDLAEHAERWEHLRDPSLLLAFDFSTETEPIPKRTVWEMNDHNSEDALKVFHSAWMNMDPWRGTKPYGEFLDEPRINLRDSWNCTFATNLRHGRPDPFHWILHVPIGSKLQSREHIVYPDPSRKVDCILDALGEKWRYIFPERINNSHAWAKNYILTKIKELKSMTEEKIHLRAQEVFQKAHKLNDDFYQKIQSKQDPFDGMELVDPEDKALVTEYKGLIDSLEVKYHKILEEEELSYEQSKNEMLGVLEDVDAEKYGLQLPIDAAINEYRESFSRLEEKFKEVSNRQYIYNLHHYWHDKAKKLEKDLSETEGEIKIFKEDHDEKAFQIINLNNSNNTLKKQRDTLKDLLEEHRSKKNASKFEMTKWTDWRLLLIVIIIFASLALNIYLLVKNRLHQTNLQTHERSLPSDPEKKYRDVGSIDRD